MVTCAVSSEHGTSAGRPFSAGEDVTAHVWAPAVVQPSVTVPPADPRDEGPAVNELMDEATGVAGGAPVISLVGCPLADPTAVQTKATHEIDVRLELLFREGLGLAVH